MEPGGNLDNSLQSFELDNSMDGKDVSESRLSHRDISAID